MHADQRFIVGLLKNDHQIIEEIYSKFSGKVIAMVERNNGDSSQAKDIFQESLISIYENAQRKDFVLTCPFEAYLLLICKRKWLNVLKKEKRVTIQDESGFMNEKAAELSNEAILHEERMRILYFHLSKLGESCQNILKLSWKLLSMQEVADKLNLSYAYARKKKSECIAQLSKNIQSDPKFNQLQHDYGL